MSGERSFATVSRDSFCVVHEGWSPSELWALAQSDSLSPVALRLQVPLKTVHRVRNSTVMQPFEALHGFWRPQRCNKTVEDRRRVFSDDTRITVTEVSLQTRQSSAGVSRQLLLGPSFAQAAADPIHLWTAIADGTQSTVQRALLDAASTDAADGTAPSLFRIVTDIPGVRRFVVERTGDDLLKLLQALRLSFPHLLSPFATSPSLSAMDATSAFLLRYHNSELHSFLPVLYFLFEQHAKSFIQFFTLLPEAMRDRIKIDEVLLSQASPKVSKSWFGFGSSSDSAPNESNPLIPIKSYSEEQQFIESEAKNFKTTLPEQFGTWYKRAVTRQDAAANLGVVTQTLLKCLENEAEALESLAGCITLLQADATMDCTFPILRGDRDGEPPSPLVLSSSSSTAADAVAVVAPPPPVVRKSLRDVNRVLKDFVTLCSVHQAQVTIPLVSGLKIAVGEAELYSMSVRQYQRVMIQLSCFVKEKEDLVTGKVSLKNTNANQNPVILAQLKDLYARHRTTLRHQRTTFVEDMSRNDRYVKEAFSRSKTAMVSVVYHWLDALDERHYSELPRHFDPTSGTDQQKGEGGTSSMRAPHPVLLLLSDVPTADLMTRLGLSS